MSNTDFLRAIGVEHPIVLAPMSGAGTPELAAAVCRAGGLGSIAAAYLQPDQIAADICRTRSLTNRPFNVNLFAGGYQREVHADAGPMLDLLGEIHQVLGIPPPHVTEIPPDPFHDQLEVILEERPAVFSFTFGIPDPDSMARLKSRGIATIGTATTPEEALLLEASGVDAIVAQGSEAGAHRGTFAGPFDQAMIPAFELVRQIRNAVRIPVIASGGLMDGNDIRRALACGAVAAQMGTAFLTCPESAASDPWKRAILESRTDSTVITRAFSGRPARGLRNAFIAKVSEKEDIILPFPVQNTLTQPMRKAAARLGQAAFLSLWAGQGVARARSIPASDLVRRLIEEMNGAA